LKPLIALFLIIGAVLATPALGEDTGPQPLTRVDCEAAPDRFWSESANVCESGDKGALDLKSQPLARSDCEQAGMWWNENALACDDASARKATVEVTNPVGSSIRITIDKATQKMTVLVNGEEKYDWPVSTGKRGYSTPSGMFTATSMNEIWYSKEWDNAPMPHAIFFMKDGHAIHGSYEVKYLGKPASHGCVRLAPKNAAILYDLVKKTGLDHTQVVLTGETPGGESNVGKIASSARSQTHYGQAPQPKRRGGFFRRLFGGP
jgi:hypothetical protein